MITRVSFAIMPASAVTIREFSQPILMLFSELLIFCMDSTTSETDNETLSAESEIPLILFVILTINLLTISTLAEVCSEDDASERIVPLISSMVVAIFVMFSVVEVSTAEVWVMLPVIWSAAVFTLAVCTLVFLLL
jgi:hypothetical protein